MTNSIIVVEDDENQREFLAGLLSDNGYLVKSAESGTAALKLIEKITPDLVLLDLGLPDIGGETVFREIKKNYPQVSIILLTARGKSSDIVEGFKLGADDYIAKPYNDDELLARIEARLRSGGMRTKLTVADLKLDTKAFEVVRGNKKINLTPKEFKLLEYLIANKNQVLSREMILNRVWLYPEDIETRAVDVYIGYLRKKIDTGFKKKLIQSMRGYGYSIKE